MAPAQDPTASDLRDESTKKNFDGVERMVAARPNILSEKYEGLTSLCRILNDGKSQEFNLRILKYADGEAICAVNQKRLLFCTVIHLLSFHGRDKELSCALAISATCVNFQNQRTGYTPLHELVSNNLTPVIHQKTAVVLRRHGADPNIICQGCTPIELYLKMNKKCDDSNKQQMVQILHTNQPSFTEGEEGPSTSTAALSTNQPSSTEGEEGLSTSTAALSTPLTDSGGRGNMGGGNFGGGGPGGGGNFGGNMGGGNFENSGNFGNYDANYGGGYNSGTFNQGAGNFFTINFNQDTADARRVESSSRSPTGQQPLPPNTVQEKPRRSIHEYLCRLS